MLNILTFKLGTLTANCYLVWDSISKDGFIVDPGDKSQEIVKKVEREGITIKYIIATHGHFDHTNGFAYFSNQFPSAQLLMHKNDQIIYEKQGDEFIHWGVRIESPIKVEYFDQKQLFIGEFLFQIVNTPGHSPGSICIFNDEVLFSGDTLFSQNIGRTDFKGGSMNSMKDSLHLLNKLMRTQRLYPGHDEAGDVQHALYRVKMYFK